MGEGSVSAPLPTGVPTGSTRPSVVISGSAGLGLICGSVRPGATAAGLPSSASPPSLPYLPSARRNQLERREAQGQRGQRYLAGGEQVDGGVLLARRRCDDLQAGIENFLAGHHQLRLAAAE